MGELEEPGVEAQNAEEEVMSALPASPTSQAAAAAAAVSGSGPESEAEADTFAEPAPPSPDAGAAPAAAATAASSSAPASPRLKVVVLVAATPKLASITAFKMIAQLLRPEAAEVILVRGDTRSIGTHHKDQNPVEPRMLHLHAPAPASFISFRLDESHDLERLLAHSSELRIPPLPRLLLRSPPPPGSSTWPPRADIPRVTPQGSFHINPPGRRPRCPSVAARGG